jgi:periplasmic divalent cation tolerance protein
MNDVIQVHTTTDQHSVANTLARELVAERLAACVQISGPIKSTYRWHGNIETAEEWSCAIKTLQHLYPQVERRIRELHTYDEPEIIAVRLEQASPSYVRWLKEQLVDPSGPT